MLSSHIARFCRCLLFICICAIALQPTNAYDKEMSVYVNAGTKECFYHKVLLGEVIEFDYQVIDGGHGDLDISFMLLDPIGMIIVTDFKKSENYHRHEVRQEGDYQFCFDNSFSTYNRKTVFFEVIVERPGQKNHDEAKNTDYLDGLTPEEYLDMTIQDIMDYLARIKMHITKVRQLQDMVRSSEARDRNLAEYLHSKVNWWSCMQLCAMIFVALLQVFMLKSIFETNSRMNKLWEYIGFS